MRKVIGAFVSVMMLVAAFVSPQAQAAPTTTATPATAAIKIFINGDELVTDQPPIMVNSRVLVPLRGIFEALDAKVGWNSKLQTVTATKGSTTVVLKIGSQSATINNTTVTLDTPAQMKSNRTMVPIRFVVEALGADVKWNASTRSVLITTESKQVEGATYLSTSVSKQYGDGRDVKVSFAPPDVTTYVKHYRIMVVKAENAASFTLAKALALTSDKYTTFPASYNGQYTILSALTKDVDGAVLRGNQSYKVFVLTVGEENNVLTGPTSSFDLMNSKPVDVATNVKISDTNDYGDGRDLTVTFTKANNDSNLSSYRIMIVRTADASKFNLEAANKVSSNNYTTVNKTSSSTLTTILSSTSRDTSGLLLQNGVAYTAFVLSVAGNNTYTNNLSAASPSVTLTSSILAPFITGVTDIANNGNGSDLRVSFNKSLSESLINKYRVFVVPESGYSSFTVAEANAVVSGRYTDISKTGNNITLTLASTAKDVKGNAIVNGVAYRIFVMGVSNNTAIAPNGLSLPSASMTLIDTGINPITGLTVRDLSDSNNGTVLQVSFTKAAIETNIGFYRIFVVKATDLKLFNLATAVVSSNANNGNYTTVYKTGNNITTNLPADARDWTGSLIQSGVSYHVFVLSIGTGSYYGSHALSTQSAAITLKSVTVPAATNLTVSDAGDQGNGQDLQVSFTKATNEASINQYRIFIVKSANAKNFNLATANSITNSNYYTNVAKTGSNISLKLAAAARDTNGDLIQNGISYNVFVMSIAAGTGNTNALSASSGAITLTTTAVPPVTSIVASDNGDQGNGQDMKVTFTRPANESNINHYRIYVVNPLTTSNFNLNAAISTNVYTFAPVGSSNVTLAADAKDVAGAPIQNGINYQVYVLAAGNNFSASTLSNASNTIMLTTTLTAPTVTTSQVNNDLTINVSIANSNEAGISTYAILVSKTALTLVEANNQYNKGTNISKTVKNITVNADITEAPLEYTTYYVYVLAIADNRLTSTNALSTPSMVTLAAASTTSE